jgi:2-amino-4-hydroxy-6-hydroxymethyldihydropteridine diphosphokinase
VHQAYLSLGSNIQPEVNLPGAIDLLRQHGEILQISRAWESQAEGSDGPNFLNACVLFHTPSGEDDLKDRIILPIETNLGRVRNTDRYAPRTIDIDIVLFDGSLCNDKYLKQVFVVVPLAEIRPTYIHPFTNETILETARRLRESVWVKARPDVLSPYNGISLKS